MKNVFVFTFHSHAVSAPRTSPPAIDTFLSSVGVKNPIHRLSGETNTPRAKMPGSWRASSSSVARTINGVPTVGDSPPAR